MKLDVVAEGVMNAVAFWFDLHLDEEESLCSGAAALQLLCQVFGSDRLQKLSPVAYAHLPSVEMPFASFILARIVDRASGSAGYTQVQRLASR